MYFNRHPIYGHKHCRIGRKSFIRQTLAWFYFNWKSNRGALLLNRELEAAHCHIHFCGPSNHLAIYIHSIFMSNAAILHAMNLQRMASAILLQWVNDFVFCRLARQWKCQRFIMKRINFLNLGLSSRCVCKWIYKWIGWKMWCSVFGLAGTTFGRSACTQSHQTFR